MKVIIGTDIGTSGVKVLAVDENCRVVGSNVTEYPIYTPNPGWTEQNPDDWWNAAAAGLKKLIPQLSGYEIAGVGLSGQMHAWLPLMRRIALSARRYSGTTSGRKNSVKR